MVFDLWRDSFTEQAQRYLSNKTIVVNELKVEAS